MSRTTRIVVTAVSAAIAVGGLLFLLGLPRSGAQVTPNNPTVTTVDQGRVGSVDVLPSDGRPAPDHNH